MIDALAWYELALLFVGLFMVGSVFGWILACLARLRRRGHDERD